MAGASEEAIAFEIVKYLITISLHLERQERFSKHVHILVLSILNWIYTYKHILKNENIQNKYVWLGQKFLGNIERFGFSYCVHLKTWMFIIGNGIY